DQTQADVSYLWQAGELAIERHSVAGKALRRTQRHAETGSDRRPKAGQALACEHKPPGDARSVERRQTLPAEQTQLVEHHQRQRLVAAAREIARPDPGHWQPCKMLSARRSLPPLLPRQRQIELAAADRLNERHTAVDAHLDLDARMRAPEMAEHLRQPGLGKIPQHAKAHLAGERRLLERRHRLIVELEQAARIAEHDLAFGRERETAPLFAQQRLAGRLL